METINVTLSDLNAGVYTCTTITENTPFDVTTITSPSTLTIYEYANI